MRGLRGAARLERSCGAGRQREMDGGQQWLLVSPWAASPGQQCPAGLRTWLYRNRGSVCRNSGWALWALQLCSSCLLWGLWVQSKSARATLHWEERRHGREGHGAMDARSWFGKWIFSFIVQGDKQQGIDNCGVEWFGLKVYLENWLLVLTEFPMPDSLQGPALIAWRDDLTLTC